MKPTNVLVHISEIYGQDAHLCSFVFPAVPRSPWQNHALRMYMTKSGAGRSSALALGHVTRYKQVGVAFSSCMASGLRSALGPSSTIDPEASI